MITSLHFMVSDNLSRMCSSGSLLSLRCYFYGNAARYATLYGGVLDRGLSMRNELTDCNVEREGFTSSFDDIIQARRCRIYSLLIEISRWGPS